METRKLGHIVVGSCDACKKGMVEGEPAFGVTPGYIVPGGFDPAIEEPWVRIICVECYANEKART